MTSKAAEKSTPPILGVLETAIYVEDVGTAAAFYKRILGLAALSADDRFVALNAGPASVLLIFRRGGTLRDIHLTGGVIPAHDGNGPIHFAFGVPRGTMDDWRRHLVANDVAITGEMAWPQGGQSLYFNDPDGYVVELATPGIWANDP